MDALVIHETETAQWQALVHEAQQAANQPLNEELESYLVFLLMRFTQKPDMAAAVLALEYLESLMLSPSGQQDKLRDVGDQCLLYSGLFPHRAGRKRVKISYFVQLGRTAYHQLSLTPSRIGDIYEELAACFVNVMDVLHAMRQMNRAQKPLSPLEALELWQDTGSRFAYQSIHSGKRTVIKGSDKIN